jgi:ATP phosphoribosyltransferase
VVLVRATDVPTYVQYGGADLGVAGKDVLIEHGGEGCTSRWTCDRALPHERGRARISTTPARRAPGLAHPVATKYTAIAREHFADKGVHVDLIKLYGSMELAPLTGLADAIVDLVSTGKHAQGQPAGRGRAHHGHQLAPGGQPGCAQAQARPIRRIIDAFAAGHRRPPVDMPS